jgi:hypothetical protein
MTLLLALVILAVLTLCVWAGLHFYQRSVAPKARPATGRRYAPGTPRADRRVVIPEVHQTVGDDHEFSA